MAEGPRASYDSSGWIRAVASYVAEGFVATNVAAGLMVMTVMVKVMMVTVIVSSA